MTRKAVLHYLAETALISIISILCFIIFFNFFLKPFTVEGMSMEPLLYDGDMILVRRLYGTPEISRGDVVVLLPSRGIYAVKRVIAVEGDMVTLKNGEIFVNSEIKGKITFGVGDLSSTSGEMRIEKGHVYLLGDNRKMSLDSRVWGPVPVEKIYGKSIFLYKKAKQKENGRPDE